jgi:serine/threonine protein kinase
MGQVLSRRSVAPVVSNDTHHFQATIQSGTLVYVALSKQTHKLNPLTDSQNIENTLFFGFNVPFEDIKIEDRIGAGNFGTVYKAYYKGKRIALKQLLAQQVNQKTVTDFQNELNILSILTHTNIVQFLGAVLAPPNLCLLTELCAGSVVDLLHLAQSRKINITWGLTLEIALGCAKACAYLHGLDPVILHRDIKAENLLLTETFGCKLSDFGLSRSLPRNANAQTMCGTPRWLAPEVFRGEDYSEKIDVYSYGIVLW